MSIAKQLIKHLRLEKLEPEGGWFRQTYLSSLTLGQLNGYEEEKMAGTAIYYLLTNEENVFSEFHKLPTDEVYHFYMGDPVTLVLLYPDGKSQHITLGHDVLDGQHVQYVVPAGVWQGSYVKDNGEYALMGTTMAPGFSFSDYKDAQREQLLADYPQESQTIMRLTRVKNKQ